MAHCSPKGFAARASRGERGERWVSASNSPPYPGCGPSLRIVAAQPSQLRAIELPLLPIPPS